MHRLHLSYTLGDAYTLDYWIETAKKIEDMGAKFYLYQRYGRTCLYHTKQQSLYRL